MSKIENIKQIVVNTIANGIIKSENPNGGADWAEIVSAVNARYSIKDWVKEVRNPMQALIAQDVIQRTDSVFDEVYVLTQTTKDIIKDMNI